MEQIKDLWSWRGTLKNDWSKNFPPMFRFYRRDLLDHRENEPMFEARALIDEGEFSDLVKLWRLDHPEPVKVHSAPHEMTKCESDEESD